MMARNGFFHQMAKHSTTSQYGTLSRGPRMISDEMRKTAEKLLKHAQEFGRKNVT